MVSYRLMAKLTGFRITLTFNTLSLIFYLLLTFPVNVALAQKPPTPYLPIAENTSPDISNQLRYFKETDVKLTPGKAVDYYRKGLFKLVQSNIFNQPYTLNNLWLGLGVKNSSGQPLTFYYEIANPHLHQLELFKSDSGKLISLGASGDAVP